MKKAIILNSGGIDSLTCLAIAKQAGFSLYSLSVDYGQKHISELSAAQQIAAAMQGVQHQVLDLRSLGAITCCALTDDSIAVQNYQPSDSIPNTYVPARNIIFLSLALSFAETVEAEAIYIGANAADHAGYPDCQPKFLQAFQAMASVGSKSGSEGHPVQVQAPLLHLQKHEIIAQGLALGVDYTKTVSCYRADEQGAACGQCDACVLRRQGFAKVGVADPTKYRE